MHRELLRSIERYEEARDSRQASEYVRRMLRIEERFVIMFQNQLYVSYKHASLHKHKAHYFFSLLLSMHATSRFQNFMFTWDVGARGTECKMPVPCLVIAKVDGYKQSGILVPNPYFAHAEEWDMRSRDWASPSRDRRIFWRGAVNAHCSSGNAARIEALKIARQSETLFDVKCTKFDPCPELAPLGEEQCGDFVDVSNFSKFYAHLNLPGTMGGSYSRNLNYLWPQASAILLWDGPAVEWYYPALVNGVTHLAVDRDSLGQVARVLFERDGVAEALAAQSLKVYQTFLCGSCLARYWRDLVVQLRRQFRFDLVLDNPINFAKAFRPAGDDENSFSFDCSTLRRVSIGANVTRFYDDTHATPHTGHPCVYEPLPPDDPLAKICRGDK